MRDRDREKDGNREEDERSREGSPRGSPRGIYCLFCDISGVGVGVRARAPRRELKGSELLGTSTHENKGFRALKCTSRNENDC